MDNLSGVSLSDSCSVDGTDFVSLVAVKSGSTEAPVNWTSRNGSKPKERRILDNQITTNNSEKVTSWMKACDEFPEVEGPKITCIRYDFDKSPKPSTIPKSCFTRTTPLFSYMEEAKKKGDYHRSNGSNLVKPENCFNPLSPETQKKELCNYLQLMKPEEKPHPLLVEYRRSGRFRTQQPKKKVEKDDTPDQTSLKSAMQAKMKKFFNCKRKRSISSDFSKLLPLPPSSVYAEITDFEESVRNLIEERQKKDANGCLGKVKKRARFNFGLKFPQKLKRRYFISNRINLRSHRRLSNISLEKLNLKNRYLRKRRHFRQEFKKKKLQENLLTPEKGENSRCEIVSFHPGSDDENVDLKNFVDDMLELDKLSEEHRKSVIETRILASNSITNLINKRTTQEADLQKAYKIFSELSNEKTETSRCEIISVHTSSDDENVDLKNFVDDMLELDKMSEEHRKSVIESRILASSSITNLINKRSTQEADVQKAYKIFSDLSSERKNPDEKENTHIESHTDDKKSSEGDQNQVDQNENTNIKDQNEVSSNLDLDSDFIFSEHDYASLDTSDELEEEEEEEEQEEEEEKEEEEEAAAEEDEESVTDGLSPVPIPDLEVLPVSKEIQTKSLHSSLTLTNKRRLFLNSYGLQNWNSGSNANHKSNHSISISKKNGSVLSATYQDFNLVIVQQNLISFWTQSALGNVLGAQNMWIPKGEIQRIALNGSYTRKHAMEMVITTETSVAFVELWTKEHKSELRQVPLADVFATVYFWRLRQNGLEKKALQLENIQGFADDVQYCVLKSYSRIIVSWHVLQGNDKKTKIHSYHLAADFQTVANISEIQPVQHYVSSLHNIEDCDSLVMGCGDNKVTLWNVEYGYIVATIEMANIKSPLATHWVKCDRGFLFTIQECVDQELRLIAINGMNHSWKKLQSFNPISGFDGLKGVCIDNGILVAYYSQGILCWNAQTGELIVEEVPNECKYIPSGKNVIMIVSENVIVRHSLSHLITDL